MSIHPMSSRQKRLALLRAAGQPARRPSVIESPTAAQNDHRRWLPHERRRPHDQTSGEAKLKRKGQTPGRAGHSPPWIGAGLDLLRPAIGWHHRALQRRLNPIATVQVGILSCDGLGALAKSGGLAINKLSTIAINDHDTLYERARVLGGDEYGAIWIDSDGREHHDPGFSDWRVNTFPDLPALPRESPVRVRLRTLDVRLPIGVTHSQFDKALTLAVSTARMDVWAKSPAGLAWCMERRIDPGRFIRFTDAQMGGIRPTRFPAQELVRFMPRLQTTLLIAIVEEVVLRLAGWQGPAPQ
jgi:hypothetical protein